MPVIVFASSKGGAGKTTSAFILATELATMGLKVTVVDADPNCPIYSWKIRGGQLSGFSCVQSRNERDIIKFIEDAMQDSDFVVVDLEGTANLSVAYATSFADLVIIPSQRSLLDAGEAAKTFALVQNNAKILKRDIPVSILLTMTSPAIRTRMLAKMQSNLNDRGVDSFETEMHKREAFNAIFDYTKTLHQLQIGQISGLEKARINAREFTLEVLRKLQDSVGEVQTESTVGELV